MDNERYSFSQAQGYEEIPGPLKLEALPKDARTRIWNLFFVHLQKSMSTYSITGESWIDGDWVRIFQDEHATFDTIRALDDWRTDFRPFCENLRERIESLPFNKVFDLIHPPAPGPRGGTPRRGRPCRRAATARTRGGAPGHPTRGARHAHPADRRHRGPPRRRRQPLVPRELAESPNRDRITAQRASASSPAARRMRRPGRVPSVRRARPGADTPAADRSHRPDHDPSRRPQRL